MKRVFSSKSGNDSYGPKWHDSDERDDELHPSPLESTGTDQISVIFIEAAKPESPAATGHAENTENLIPKVVNSNESETSVLIKTEKRLVSRLGESMYRAALEGDWVAAEVLLDQDPDLGSGYITEEGDRALHVAVAMNHKKFVQKLVQITSNPSDLGLLDGRGFTACCYAAISGAVKIARVMIEKNPNLATARDENNETPLHKAALQGNKRMLSYFLKYSKDEDLLKQEWFDLLLITIRGRIYDVALEIFEKNESVATMKNEEGTALHLLARQAVISNTRRDATSDSTSSPAEAALIFLFMQLELMLDYEDGERDLRDFHKLAEKLWNEMQKLGKSSLLELIKVPHNILHDAAKEGHVGLVAMLIRSYPQLIRDTDSNGYTIFHTAAKYRHIRLFNLICQVQPMIDLRTLMSQDESGNNILHLAAKSAPLSKMNLSPVLLMQRELQWFKAVEEILPPCCAMMRNNDKLRPRDLFSQEHKRLLKNSETWMRNTADSCMLIATILLTVVFAAVFTVPGGYGGQTGEPILVKRHWFKVFLVFEVLALISSVISIMMFRSVMASNFAEEDFLSTLPIMQMIGFFALSLSLTAALLSFMSSVSLVGLKMDWLVWLGFCISFFFGFSWFTLECAAIYRNYWLVRPTRSSRHTLFNKYPTSSNSTSVHRFMLRFVVAFQEEK